MGGKDKYSGLGVGRHFERMVKKNNQRCWCSIIVALGTQGTRGDRIRQVGWQKISSRCWTMLDGPEKGKFMLSELASVV